MWHNSFCRLGKLWEWYHLEDTGVDGKILLKWTMAGFFWLRIGTER